MEKTGAKSLYDSLGLFNDLDNLINIGEAENIFLECKSPKSPSVGQDLKSHLAKAISGFSNTEGGIIIYGMDASEKAGQGGVDVINQVEPIGNVKRFHSQLINLIPQLTIPAVTSTESKIIKKKKSDTRGVVIIYIPKNLGDPIQSNADEHFYFRSGDKFVFAPHDMIKRLFSATESPDLGISFKEDIFEKDKNGFWKIPIAVSNRASAVGEDVHVTVEILNAESCDGVKSTEFMDRSNINPKRKIYMSDVSSVMHRGLDVVTGYISVKMKDKKIKLEISVTLYANKMRARRNKFILQLNKNKFKIKKLKDEFVY